MAKSGRERKPGPSEPNDKPSRTVRKVTETASPTAVRRLRDAALARMLDKEWSTELGRHFLAGIIDSSEYAAGRKYWLLREAYGGRRQKDAKSDAFPRR